MPAAWAYLLFLPFASALIGISLIGRHEAASCVFFYRNLMGQMGQGMTAHFWSLSIEEQFYFVWPPLLKALGNKRAGTLAIITTALLSLHRYLNWSFYDRMYFSFRTEARADALLVGCIAALLFLEPRIKERLQRFAIWASLPAICIVCYSIQHFIGIPPTIESIAIATLIIGSLAAQKSTLVSPLRNTHLRWLGRVSYSFYIWNFFFALLSGSPLQTMMMSTLMCCFATASYYLIESPGIAFGKACANALARNPHVAIDLGPQHCLQAKSPASQNR